MRWFGFTAGVAMAVAISCALPDDFQKVGTNTAGGGGAAAPGGGAPSVGGSTAVVGGGGASTTSAGGNGSGGDQGGCALPANDDFDGSDLAAWTVSPGVSGVSYDVAGGELTVSIDDTPMNYAWYNADRGWFAHHRVCGDFAAVVEVYVANFAGGGVPAYDFNSGGLLARHPNQPSNDEFWAMVTIGVQDAATQRAETKATQHSVSDVTPHDLLGGPTLSGRVGLCRVGTMIRLSAEPTGGVWETLATFDAFMSGAPDGEVSLPDEVEVGVVANAWADQDAEVTFDNFEMWVPSGLGDCVD